MSRFIRRGRSASGAVTVQVVDKDGSRIVDVVHVGSANTDADLAVLMERAEAMLHPDQEMLDVGAVRHAALSEVADWTKARQRPLEAPARGRPRSSASGGGVVVGQPARLLWQVLCEAYEHLGFACLDDDAFMKIVLARIVEPTSKIDSIRVLEGLGVKAPSISTIYRMLERVTKGGYRDKLAQACFTHASRRGPLTLVMYDATTLICRRRHIKVYADVWFMPMFGVGVLVAA